ncbi:MAG: hypothetical protein WCF18_03095 [Chthoniobacteraceae bacterium]
MLRRSLREIDQQAGVVELAVVIFHPAAQPILRERGNALQHLFARKHLRRPKAISPREQVTHLEPDAEERCLPPRVVRHDEFEIADEVRRIAQQDAALFQRLHH